MRGEIRRGSPRYAELTRPRLLEVEDVRRELLDDETLLLEYRLGEEESWLWAIGRESFSAHVLPPRGEIEPLVRQAVAWTQSLEWSGDAPPVLCELSEILLSPVADRLAGTAGRRVVLVPHGELETLANVVEQFEDLRLHPSGPAELAITYDYIEPDMDRAPLTCSAAHSSSTSASCSRIGSAVR